MTNLFAYGTLMDARVFERVVGAKYESCQAVLTGYERFAFANECYPGIVPSNHENAIRGVLYLNIQQHHWLLLDNYESSMYKRVNVLVNTLVKSTIEADTYVVEPPFRNRLVNKPWDFDEFVANHLDKYLREA